MIDMNDLKIIKIYIHIDFNENQHTIQVVVDNEN